MTDEMAGTKNGHVVYDSPQGAHLRLSGRESVRAVSHPGMMKMVVNMPHPKAAPRYGLRLERPVVLGDRGDVELISGYARSRRLMCSFWSITDASVKTDFTYGPDVK